MKKRNLFILLVWTIVSSSCNFFEVGSPSLAESEVFLSANEVERVIAGIYELFTEDCSYRNRLGGPWEALSTDIETYRGTGAPDYATHSMTTIGHSDITKVGSHPWLYLTTAIERANVCIDGIENNSDTTKSSFRYLYGEALTLRAWLYYEMTKLWGDVPYSFEPLDINNTNSIYPVKVDRNKIYDKLRIDLRHAAELMGNSKEITWPAAQNNVERMNREFALGLLAKIDLVYAGKALRPDIWIEGGGASCRVQFNEKDPQKRSELLGEAVWACEQVMIADGIEIGGKLLSDYEQVFKNICSGEINYSKTETLWEIPFANNIRGQVLNRCGEAINANALNHLTGTTSTSKRNGKIVVVPNFVFKFEPNDKRKWVTINPYQWVFDADKTPAITQNTKTGNILYQKADNIQQFSLGKYRYEWLGYEMEADDDGVNLPIMRYSEILLMYAEASIGSVSEVAPNYKGSFDAQDIFNIVRRRAGLDNKELSMAAIQDERAFEFCGERIRKYDLMRWGIFAETLKKAQEELLYFTKATDNKIDFTGTPYEGLLSSKVYFRYVDDPSCSKDGTAYIINEIYGLTLGENSQPDDYVDSSETGGWVQVDPYVTSGSPRMNANTIRLYAISVEDDLENHQYWPLFDVITSSNHNLWNDYGY